MERKGNRIGLLILYLGHATDVLLRITGHIAMTRGSVTVTFVGVG